MLATREDERHYVISGAATIDGAMPGFTLMPFGIFPKIGLEKVELSDVTVFCGSSNTEKALLLRLIAIKSGTGLSESDIPRCMDDYCRLSSFRYVDFNNRSFPCELITKERNRQYTEKRYKSIDKDKIWSVVQLYEDLIEQPALYLLEEPDSCMSLSEQIELALLITDAVKYYGAQFIITTNSPVLLGIRNALIYDFDSSPILPLMWSDSPYAKQYAGFHRELTEAHTRGRKKK